MIADNVFFVFSKKNHELFWFRIQKSRRHSKDFPSGLPPQYYPSLLQFSYRVRMGSDAFYRGWSLTDIDIRSKKCFDVFSLFKPKPISWSSTIQSYLTNASKCLYWHRTACTIRGDLLHPSWQYYGQSSPTTTLPVQVLFHRALGVPSAHDV